MALRFMLDTNILSELVRNPHGRAARRARAVQDEVCTSVVVAAELRYGCAKRGSPALSRRVEELLDEIGILALDAPADVHYGQIRSGLETAGQPIGGNDLLIAAHARALELTLVTANLREFARIPDLKIENWMRR